MTSSDKKQAAPPSPLRVAVVGCVHGELDLIYDTLRTLPGDSPVDLLLCCGDFQATRNMDDLETMACPPKYRRMNTFHKYYTGEKVAPVMTIFIGGNHEASNYMLELIYGGWVAPNIYYLGAAGVVRFGGLRIAGLSGIYNSNDFRIGRYECPPFNAGSMRSVYHVREFDMFRLLQLTEPIDVFLSHDWPGSIAHYGDKAALFRRKGFLRDEVESHTLGNPHAMKLLQVLQPSCWFAAHLHVKFAAIYRHPPAAAAAAAGPAVSVVDTDTVVKMTRFLALGKCLSNHDYLQVLEFPHATQARVLQYDMEWLAIMRSTHALQNFTRAHTHIPTATATAPGVERYDYRPTADERQWLAEHFGSPLVPQNFTRVLPPFDPATAPRQGQQPGYQVNPQTTHLLQRLQLPDLMSAQFHHHQHTAPAAVTSLIPSSVVLPPPPPQHQHYQQQKYEQQQQQLNQQNPDEIALSSSDDDDDEVIE